MVSPAPEGLTVPLALADLASLDSNTLEGLASTFLPLDPSTSGRYMLTSFLLTADLPGFSADLMLYTGTTCLVTRSTSRWLGPA